MDVWEIIEQVQTDMKTFLSRTGSSFEFPSIELVAFQQVNWQIPPPEKLAAQSSDQLNQSFFFF
jgi:hypothetical protein